jgi:hypothetical protein
MRSAGRPPSFLLLPPAVVRGVPSADVPVRRERGVALGVAEPPPPPPPLADDVVGPRPGFFLAPPREPARPLSPCWLLEVFCSGDGRGDGDGDGRVRLPVAAVDDVLRAEAGGRVRATEVPGTGDSCFPALGSLD